MALESVHKVRAVSAYSWYIRMYVYFLFFWQDTKSVLVMGLFSKPRKINSDKGTPLLSFFGKDDDILQDFGTQRWKRFSSKGKHASTCATHVYHVLPFPDHTISDIGTFMATPTPSQPCPKIDMVMPGFDLENHFIQLYKGEKKYGRKKHDVLHFVM